MASTVPTATHQSYQQMPHGVSYAPQHQQSYAYHPSLLPSTQPSSSQQQQHDQRYAYGQASQPQQQQPNTQATSQPPSENPPSQDPAAPVVGEKRKRGRPKGSKTKKPKLDASTTNASQQQQSTPQSGSSSTAQQTAPAAPTFSASSERQPSSRTTESASSRPTVPMPQSNVNMQEVFEFHWKAMHMCMDFCQAASDLIAGTPEAVLSYALSSNKKVNPMQAINEAKAICDAFIADPSIFMDEAGTGTPASLPTSTPRVSLATIPPPPPWQKGGAKSSATAGPTTSTASAPTKKASASQRSSDPSESPSLPPAFPNGQYQAASSSSPAQSESPQTQQTTTTSSQPSGFPGPPAPMHPGQAVAFNSMKQSPMLHGGTWTAEDVQKLKDIVDQYKGGDVQKEVDWDWVVNQFGVSKTRHQILIKATQMGLKPSGTNGARRRKSLPEGSGPEHADVSSNGQNTSTLSLPGSSSHVNGRPIAPSPQSYTHPQQPNGPTASPRQAPPPAYNTPPALSKHNIQGTVTSTNYRQQPSPALSHRGYAPTPSPQSQSSSLSINPSIQPQQHQQTQQPQQSYLFPPQQPATHFSAFTSSPATRPPLPPPQINPNINGPMQQSQTGGTRWVPYNPPTASGAPKPPQSHHPKGLQGMMNSDLPMSQPNGKGLLHGTTSGSVSSNSGSRPGSSAGHAPGNAGGYGSYS
ncbi:uncharacterized protein EI90DRAFT_2966733 [Cantharellus anzutake]|uniref:uncharacterized protein n=1 Tax=Cantharellus anzutake TaxID=1750568 RepID=UPI001908BF41|nr:uncharacterized protein EI90DRAFT_2966733 [Cantharellus anzutake]KAF8339586.1 hypothetical protein EI90DRAFT_2966733 [Cantharellus anzutake]